MTHKHSFGTTGLPLIEGDDSAARAGSQRRKNQRGIWRSEKPESRGRAHGGPVNDRCFFGRRGSRIARATTKEVAGVGRLVGQYHTVRMRDGRTTRCARNERRVGGRYAGPKLTAHPPSVVSATATRVSDRSSIRRHTSLGGLFRLVFGDESESFFVRQGVGSSRLRGAPSSGRSTRYWDQRQRRRRRDERRFDTFRTRALKHVWSRSMRRSACLGVLGCSRLVRTQNNRIEHDHCRINKCYVEFRTLWNQRTVREHVSTNVW